MEVETSHADEIHACGSIAYYERAVLVGGGLGTADIDRSGDTLRVRLADVVKMHQAEAEVSAAVLTAALCDLSCTTEISARVELCRLCTAETGEGLVRIELSEHMSRDVVVLWIVLGERRLGIAIVRDELYLDGRKTAET
jgi:hypothetical protein